MALISRLAVALTVDTATFAKKLRSATKSVSSFGSAVVSALSGTTAQIAGLFAAITGVAGIAGFGALIQRTSQFIDLSGKLTDQIGETTEGLIGLQHAAELGGVATDSLERSLEFLQKSLGRPSGETKAALDSLGLSLNDLLGKRPVEQLKLIADKLRLLTLQETKAAAARALFGKTGADFITILKDGSAGLQKVINDVQELGASFTRVDAAKIEEANDSISRLKLVFAGFARQITISFAGPVKIVTEFFVNMRKDALQSATVISDTFGVAGDVIIWVLDKIQDGFNSVMRFAAVTLRTMETLRGLVVGSMDPEGQKRYIDNAVALEERIGQNMANKILGLDTSGEFKKRLRELNKEAVVIADEIAKKLATQNRARELQETFTKAFVTGFQKASPWIERIFNSGIEQSFKGLQGYDRQRQADAMNPMIELMRDYIPTKLNDPIATAAAGTRGTFSSEAAGRISTTLTIQQKQLDALNQIADNTQATADLLDEGVPAG